MSYSDRTWRRIQILAGLLSLSAFAFDQTGNSSAFVPPVNLAGTAADLPGVNGIALDPSGNVYFASGGIASYAVLRLDVRTGALTTFAGNGTPGYSGDGGPAASAQLDGVTGLAFDGAGNLYIADSNNNVIRKVSNGVISTLAVQSNSTPPVADCFASAPSFSGLTGIGTDLPGNLYAFLTYSRSAELPFVCGTIVKISGGMVSSLVDDNPFGLGEGYATHGGAIDSAGNFYYADVYSNVVKKVSNGKITVVAGTAEPGFSGDGGPAQDAQLQGPRGVALDRDSNLYIADTGNQRIRKVSNGIISTVAGGGTPGGGLEDGGPATQALLSYPFGVAVDPSGNLYIEDTLNRRIRMVASGTISTVAGGGSTPVLRPRSAGSFSAAAHMTTPRYDHTAVLLADGRVLILSGASSSNWKPLTQAELYDPATGVFSPTGSLLAPLYVTSTALLSDGLVLGLLDYQFQSSGIAEIYDPASGSFSAAGNLLHIAFPSAAVVLADGRVFIAGVEQSNVTPLQSSVFQPEIYDPATASFSTAGSTVFSHYSPTATLLADGRVLLAEGNCPREGALELYNPNIGSFRAAPSGAPCVPSYDPSAAHLLADGRVFFNGTPSSYSPFSGSLVYDPATGSQTDAGYTGAVAAATTLLPDGSLLVTGGETCPAGDAYTCSDNWGDGEQSVSVSDILLSDPSSVQFGYAGSLPTSLAYHQSTLLGDGRVLITGGVSFGCCDWNVLDSALLYAPPVLITAPQLFTTGTAGQNVGAIWRAETGLPVTSANPAAYGDVLALYTTGLIAGSPVPPRVSIGRKYAEIVYFGASSQYPGYFQVNFRTPAGIVSGPAAPVRLVFLDRSSNTVTTAVQ